MLHFEILKHIPIGQPISYEDVAIAAKVPISRLKSVARMAMTRGLLQEPISGQVAHSRISTQIAVDPDYYNRASYFMKVSAQTAAHFVKATQRWGDATEKNQTAYNLAFETDLPYFAHKAQSEARATEFALYMRAQNKFEGSALKHVLNGFDWPSIGRAHVVDVGLTPRKNGVVERPSI